ncbi:MAG TPA: AAA family ATPase, partial [Solirubrobacteraceae bacterium]|nr:AAA family ATPase [Solirubrobacteraceae bacterium]
MRFVTAKSTPPSEYPYAVLSPDVWDDYGYKTMWWVRVHLDPKTVLDLEHVKIVQKSQDDGRTKLPGPRFECLPSDYCSLGQAMSYYEILFAAGKEVYEPFLKGLRDMVFLSSVRERFGKQPGVVTSLMRFGSALAALEIAPAIFKTAEQGAVRSQLAFEYRFPQSDLTTEFRYGGVSELPTRTVAVIGYNGAGKTRLLGHLGMLAYHDVKKASTEQFRETNGMYIGRRPSFGGVVAISYSAYDDFEVPGHGTGRNAARNRELVEEGRAAMGNYTYIGLRQASQDGRISTVLKTIEDLTRDFHTALARARKPEREDALIAAFEPIRKEPSFEVLAELPDVTASARIWESAFARLSTGHKIVLNIIVQLCANLERRSIVLFDEPELHLHPPLLAALLRSIGVALERHDSFAVVATHSPVVLQEIPGRQVKVLRRYPGDLAVEGPEIETFGENVGALTRQVFSLDSSAT